jgi:hypothetical protein
VNLRRSFGSSRTLLLTIGFLAFNVLPRLSAQVPGLNPNAKACALLPTAALEAAYGGKAGTPHGTDGESLSICSVTVNSRVAKLQSSPPGTVGVPRSIQEGFMGLSMLAKMGEFRPKITERSAAGLTMTKDLDRKPLAKPLYSTTCFLIEGGYLNLALAGDDPKQVSFDVVKPLLEKAAARRR